MQLISDELASGLQDWVDKIGYVLEQSTNSVIDGKLTTEETKTISDARAAMAKAEKQFTELFEVPFSAEKRGFRALRAAENEVISVPI